MIGIRMISMSMYRIISMGIISIDSVMATDIISITIVIIIGVISIIRTISIDSVINIINATCISSPNVICRSDISTAVISSTICDISISSIIGILASFILLVLRVLLL